VGDSGGVLRRAAHSTVYGMAHDEKRSQRHDVVTHRSDPIVIWPPSSATNGGCSPVIGVQSVYHNGHGYVWSAFRCETGHSAEEQGGTHRQRKTWLRLFFQPGHIRIRKNESGAVGVSLLYRQSSTIRPRDRRERR
jgi:hypothetical protein